MTEIIRLDSRAVEQVQKLLNGKSWLNGLAANKAKYLGQGPNLLTFGVLENGELTQAIFVELVGKTGKTYAVTKSAFDKELFNSLCLASSSHSPTVTHHEVYVATEQKSRLDVAWRQSRLGQYTNVCQYYPSTPSSLTFVAMITYPE
jgi:hypothetical protein